MKVLVVGDWLVDDHWATTAIDSHTASFSGYNYLISSNTTGDSVREAGGVGRIASFLHSAALNDSNTGQFDVTGLGVWHEKDTEALENATFNPPSIAGETPHRLTKSSNCPLPLNLSSKCRLINLGKYLNSNEYVPAGEKTDLGDKKGFEIGTYGTSRIFRIYQGTGGDLKLANRIDWTLSPKKAADGRADWFPGEQMPQSCADALHNEILTKVFKGDTAGTFDIVAIKDMGKGAVSTALIKWISESPMASQASYFVASRSWNPSWLNALVNKDVRLIFYNEVAFRECKEITTWITGTKNVAPDASHDAYQSSQ